MQGMQTDGFVIQLLKKKGIKRFSTQGCNKWTIRDGQNAS